MEIPSRVVSATVPGFFVVFFCVNDNWWNETSALLEGTLKSGMSTWHGHATEPLTKKICAYRYVRLIIIYPGRLCFVFFFNFRYSCNEITKHTKKIVLDKDVDEKKRVSRRISRNIFVIMSKVLTVLILEDYYCWSRDQFVWIS